MSHSQLMLSNALGLRLVSSCSVGSQQGMNGVIHLNTSVHIHQLYLEIICSESWCVIIPAKMIHVPKSFSDFYACTQAEAQ